jgi:hypothetical protein
MHGRVERLELESARSDFIRVDRMTFYHCRDEASVLSESWRGVLSEAGITLLHIDLDDRAEFIKELLNLMLFNVILEIPAKDGPLWLHHVCHVRECFV